MSRVTTPWMAVGSHGSFGSGSDIWANTNNILVEDSSNATSSEGASGGQSDYLRAHDFGFMLPDDAVIVSVEARFKCVESGATIILDVYLISGTTLKGSDQASTGTLPTSTLAWETWGDGGDWGWTDISASDVNSSNFGVAFKVGFTGIGAAGVDHVQMRITYEASDNLFMGVVV